MKIRKIEQMPLTTAILIFVAGCIIGTVFTFGMQYWNKSVDRDSCEAVETEFLSYELYERRRSSTVSIDCANGQRFFIESVLVTEDLMGELDKLIPQQEITLLVHPNSDVILEFTTYNETLLVFEDSIMRLKSERTGFFFLGIFMYLCAAAGLYYIIFHSVQYIKRQQKIPRERIAK